MHKSKNKIVRMPVIQRRLLCAIRLSIVTTNDAPKSIAAIIKAIGNGFIICTRTNVKSTPPIMLPTDSAVYILPIESASREPLFASPLHNSGKFNPVKKLKGNSVNSVPNQNENSGMYCPDGIWKKPRNPRIRTIQSGKATAWIMRIIMARLRGYLKRSAM